MTKHSKATQNLTVLLFRAKERKSNVLNIKYEISYYLFFSKRHHCRSISNFCLQILLTRKIPSIKLNNKLKVASCFLWCNFLGYVYHINLYSKSPHLGDRLPSEMLHLRLQAQRTLAIKNRWDWARRKQIFHRWCPLHQFQLAILDTKATQKFSVELGLFSEPTRKKMPSATLMPLQLHSICSNQLKNKSLEHLPSWNISRAKGKHRCFLSLITFWNNKWKPGDTIHCCYFLKSGIGSFTSSSKGASFGVCILPERMFLFCCRRWIIRHHAPLHV